jgi:hypothetical protein
MGDNRSGNRESPHGAELRTITCGTLDRKRAIGAAAVDNRTRRTSKGLKSSLSPAGSARRVGAILLGCGLIIGGLAYYQGLSYLIPVGGVNSDWLTRSGYAVAAFLSVGLASCFWGLTRGIKRAGLNSSQDSSLTIRMISMVVRERPYSVVFTVSAVVYGIIFALASGILVYQPGVIFSSTYGVKVPSAVEVVCCGTFGQMPQFVLYLTENLAVLFIPINTILLLAVSWLVGLNVSLAAFAFRTRTSSAVPGWFGSVGAFVGLFSACPTCAGFLLLSALGLTSGFSVGLVFFSTQAVFVAVGFPLLLLTPLIAARRLGDEGKAVCRLAR